ncbi:MAG TPA: amino acid adenylation domain-containing protein, partial [Kofleriaceae bacterium]|nr:amino acid adenylation domain-containing protein [Kofleriaceae bacterium]
ADRLPDRADEDARAALALPVALRLLAQGQAAQVLVLDAALQPVPVGAWGELFLGLAPLAELPWRGSAADAARLLPNPFAAVPASRMVRVQQCARWRGEGQLQLARPAGQLALAPATPTSAPHEALSPEHPLRRQVAALFAEVLGAPVPADRSFFAAGGHSLLASRLVARLRERLGVAIGLRAVFEHPTVDGLAAELLRQLAQQRGSSPRTPRRIPRAPRTTELPVSFAQERLWFLDRLLAGAAGHGAGELAYVVPVVATLRGPLQRPALAAALAAVVARHEVLRASFATEGSSVVQRLSAGTSNVLELVEAQGWSPAQLAAEIEAEARRPFALARGPLWRARLLALSPAQHVLLLTLHHIVCDGWSMGVLVDELGLLYSAHVRGELASLPELELQYADYAAWQRQSLASGQLADDLVFWREQLAGLPTLELPTDHRRPAEQSYRGASVQRRLSSELASALRGLAQRHDATLFMVLLAGFATLLSKLSGQRDFAVGTPVAGRADGQLEGLVGLFVNTLVLRQRWQGEPTFAELVRQVRASTLRAFEHQDVPFERLVEELRPERDLSRNPLVQVMFEVATGMRRPPRFVGLELELAEGDTGAAKLDLLVHVEDEGADLLVTLEYASDLYDAASADRMLAQYERLLASAIAHPGHRIGELDVLDPGERARLAAWNQTSHPLPASLLAHERFEEVVRRAPGRLAASDDRERLDYATLNARANGVAHALLAAGVGPEDRVVLYSERDVNLLAAILGTWKAGAAYVPVDPAYPTDRVRQILMRSACRVVVIGRSVLQDLEASADSFGGLPVLVLEDLVTAGGPNPGRPVAPSQLAYAIFTSGSTGVPKGAMVEHRGMFNHLLAKEVELALGESDSIIQNASQCFDISVWQFLVCVLRGGRVHVVSNQVAYDPEALLRLTREERITVLEVVPEVLRGIVELAGGVPPDLGLRWMVVTGEALPPELTRRWLAWAPRIPLVNAYGPTECSDDVTHHILRDPMPVDAVATPIGRPILNMYMYVLDEHLALQPVGARGELYVGGVGVGRGYLDDPGQTAQAFLPNPYGEPGERMYRTGDVVRWLADGTLEFLGRVDHQVKVRGYRIELGEIESVLGRHPGVDAAVVEVRGEGRAANLVAYVVPRASWRWDREVLRAWVQGALPAYMVPVKWVELAALPLSPNGKIDRRALPAPETSEPFGAGEPRSLAEAQVLALWRESFDGIALGIDDDFFALGGHSLLAAQLHGKMVELLGVKFPLRRLFEAPTVRRLMEHVLSDQLAAASVTTREELVTEVQDLTEEQALALLRKLQAE